MTINDKFRNRPDLKRLVFLLNFIFTLISIDLLASHRFFLTILKIIGWLRNTTHGGVLVNMVNNDLTNQLLSLIIMIVISLIVMYFYITRPKPLINFIKYPYALILKTISLWRVKFGIINFIKTIILSFLYIYASLILLVIVINIPFILANCISLMAIFLLNLIDKNVFEIMIYSLFLICSFFSWQLLRTEKNRK